MIFQVIQFLKGAITTFKVAPETNIVLTNVCRQMSAKSELFVTVTTLKLLLFHKMNGLFMTSKVVDVFERVPAILFRALEGTIFGGFLRMFVLLMLQCLLFR